MRRDRRGRGHPSRRHFLEGALGLAGAWALPRRVRADRYGPVGGTRVLVVGDSMVAGGFGLLLARSLGKDLGHDVTRHGKSSSGLARPDFYDWMVQARSLVGDEPFDASVVMLGGNDGQGLRMEDGGWIRWDEDGWADEYARRVASLAEILAPPQQQLFWVGMPVMGPQRLQARMPRINTIARAEMAIRRRSEFIDIWSLLAGPDGGYAETIEVPTAEPTSETRAIQVRASDGIHLTMAGAQVLADHVRGVVHRVLAADR